MLIPRPKSLETHEGVFVLDVHTRISAPEALSGVVAWLQGALRPATGLPFGESVIDAEHAIELSVQPGLAAAEFTLDVETDRIRIAGGDAAAVFYGCQALLQLLPPSIYRRALVAGTRWEVPCVSVHDAPRFGWRGVMLDVARHFMPKHDVLRFIDVMAMHRLNILHLHLTEDQGWRIEIKRYPRLTEVGSWREESQVGAGGDGVVPGFDGRPHGGFYTQDDIREIVAYAAGRFVAQDGTVVSKGDVLTLDGSTGEVMLGAVATVPAGVSGDFRTLMGWVDKFRRMKVRANADTPHDARTAREFGAEGIGLCRTEHMFFDATRIAAVREMILSADIEGRRRALLKILPMQKGDFMGLFREMKGLPVTIRLLDPPLHEFLPQAAKDIDALAATMGVSAQTLRHKVDFLHEFNPMLGHRGCRLGVTFPEIYDMQVQAIMEAACELVRDEGFSIVPEIMIPLVSITKELGLMRANAVAVCEDVIARYGVKVEYLIGTMIELPRAAIIADSIASEADFFSFGTNDLTQTAFGLSRDDAGKFLPFYVENGILEDDPFVTLDQVGVGALIRMGCEKGRQTRPGIKLGICGEHGGDPASVIFCDSIGLDYVSCSPFRVPIARLAAAHATLNG